MTNAAVRARDPAARLQGFKLKAPRILRRKGLAIDSTCRALCVPQMRRPMPRVDGQADVDLRAPHPESPRRGPAGAGSVHLLCGMECNLIRLIADFDYMHET